MRPAFTAFGLPQMDRLAADNAVTSRRSFLFRSAGTALGLAGIAWTRPAWSEEAAPTTPADALKRLMEGNARFVGRRLQSPGDDLGALRQSTAHKQDPFAAVLACADSRVPVELIFDESIGRIFTTRVAGNVAGAEVIASLEYAVAHLATPLVMVMGHADCGAVKAAIAGEQAPGQITTLYRYIRPAIDQAGTDGDAVIKANARYQARLLSESSPVMAEHLKDATLRVVASLYDVATGTVTLLEGTS